jgi:hypothetical protein
MEKKVTKSQRSTHFFIFIIRFHQFFPPISSCCHLISSVFLTYFWILSVWIDRFSPTHLFISTYLFYHSLSSVFPTGVFIYHLIPSVFPTYFLMLPWVFFNFPDLFIHVVHHFQPFSLPDPSLYHSIPSMFPTYVIWSLDVTNFPTISVFYHLPSSIFRPISSFFISIGFKKNRDAFYHWTSWVVLSFFHCLDVWWFSNFFVFFGALRFAETLPPLNTPVLAVLTCTGSKKGPLRGISQCPGSVFKMFMDPDANHGAGI